MPVSRRIAILGGGYAGLSAAARLGAQSDLQVELIDAEDSFLDAIQIHKSVYRPISNFRTEYQSLSKRLGFSFRRAETLYDRALLGRWLEQGAIPHDQGRTEFDALILASGARSLPLARQTDPDLLGYPVLSLEDVKRYGMLPAIDRLAAESDEERCISVVGGGATGMQFLFELADCLQGRRLPAHLRLIDLEQRTLPAFPSAFHDYAARKMEKRGIEYLPGLRFLRQEGREVAVRRREGEEQRLRSDLTLLFPGVAPHPATLRCDAYGRVLAGAGGQPLERVFAAGDCSHFEGRGLNSATAQAAVRKGRLAADNAAAALRGQTMRPYEYSTLGYFVSLGMHDGIGWMLRDDAILTGLPAYALKETIESQFDWFLSGVDTYFG